MACGRGISCLIVAQSDSTIKTPAAAGSLHLHLPELLSPWPTLRIDGRYDSRKRPYVDQVAEHFRERTARIRAPVAGTFSSSKIRVYPTWQRLELLVYSSIRSRRRVRMSTRAKYCRLLIHHSIRSDPPGYPAKAVSSIVHPCRSRLTPVMPVVSREFVS